MSDDEGGSKPGGYRIELSKTKAAGCKGPKPCKGTKIQKGELRFGTLVDMSGHTSFAWRHWGCVTPAVLQNMAKKLEGPEELDGYEDVGEENQAKIRTAWEEGHVADEDIPESARKPEEPIGEGDDDGDGKKKKKAPAKKREPKKKKQEDGATDDEKPAPKRGARTKAKADEEMDEDDEKPARKPRAPRKKKADEEGADEEKETKKAPRKRATAKAKTAKKDDDEEDEAAVVPAPKKRQAPKKRGAAKDEDEDEDDDEEKPKKKAAPKKTTSKAAKKAKANDSDLEEIHIPSELDGDESDGPVPTKKASKAKTAKDSKAERVVAEPPKRTADEDYGDEELASGEDENVSAGSKRKRSAPNSGKEDVKKAKPSSSAKPASKSKPASTASASRSSKRGKVAPVEAVTEEDEIIDD